MSFADRSTRGVTRRTFLRAMGIAFAAGFTAIADELAKLLRWCCFDDPRFAGAG